jgi:hypothetical protein
MSPRAKTCQIVPTTFQGISSGNAITTRQSATPKPRRGMDRATAMPSGIWIARQIALNSSVRQSESKKRRPSSVEGSSSSRNHSVPFQKNSLFPKLSCTE